MSEERKGVQNSAPLDAVTLLLCRKSLPTLEGCEREAFTAYVQSTIDLAQRFPIGGSDLEKEVIKTRGSWQCVRTALDDIRRRAPEATHNE